MSKPREECCRFEIIDGNVYQIMTHAWPDGELLPVESGARIVPSTYPIYIKWLALGNVAPIINTPIPPVPPKYTAMPSGVLPMDWRRYMYTTFVDPHVMAATSYTLEGEVVKSDAEKVIALAEKAAIRLEFPDAP
jgi:hypothetical protein